ncbi:hypothetical protein ABKN59_009294 [Abortiporus biennis]
MNGQSVQHSFQHNPHYYFPDGNIVLVAENDAFRVHGGVLSIHSNIFRDMINIPRPSNDEHIYDNCPIVPLSETADEVRIMLSALYDSISNFKQGRKPLPFSGVAVMLRLGVKYEIDQLRDEAVDRFKQCFPTKLSCFQLLKHESSLPGLRLPSDEVDDSLPIRFSDKRKFSASFHLHTNVA